MSPDHPKSPNESADHLERLRRQQAILARFGQEAIEKDDLSVLLDDAVREAAEGLGVRYAKILQYRAQPDDFLAVAGVGWSGDIVGNLVMPNGLTSPAGFAFHVDGPAVSNDLDQEERFQVPPVLKSNGVRSASNVIIRTRSGRWGVLEVDSREVNAFDDAATDFLLSFANILGLTMKSYPESAR